MNHTDDRLMTQREAAAFLTLSQKTLEAWRGASPPRGPKFVRMGTRIAYWHSDLITWAERNTAATIDDPI